MASPRRPQRRRCFAGFLGYFGGQGETRGWIHWFLGQTLNPHETAAASVSEHSAALPYQLASSLIAIVGIAIAWYFFKVNRPASDKVGIRLRPLVNFLYNKWYIDELYRAIILKPVWILALTLSIFDRYIIDGVVFLIAFIPQVVGYSLKPTQRGVLQRYAVGMVAGLAAIILGVMYLLRS